MKRYMKYVKPYKTAFILGPLLMIVEILGEVIMPKLMALLINNGIANKDSAYIAAMGGSMIGIAFLMMIGGIGGAYFGAKASINFAADLRTDTFKNVQKFSFSNIDNFSTGSLVTRLTNDITQIQNLVNMCLRMMLRAPGMLIGAIIMAFVMNARLAVIVLIVVPIIITLIAIIIRLSWNCLLIPSLPLQT